MSRNVARGDPTPETHAAEPEGDGALATPPPASTEPPSPSTSPSSPSAPPPRPAPTVSTDQERAPGLDAPPRGDRPHRPGLGLTIAGGVLTPLGTSTWVAGVVFLGLSARERNPEFLQVLGLSTLVPGIVVATAGYVMLGVGIKRMRASRRAQQRVTATFRLDPRQAGAGLSLRF